MSNQNQYRNYCETTGKYQTIDDKLIAAGVTTTSNEPSNFELEHEIERLAGDKASEILADIFSKNNSYETRHNALAHMVESLKDATARRENDRLIQAYPTRRTNVSDEERARRIAARRACNDLPQSLYPNKYSYDQQK